MRSTPQFWFKSSAALLLALLVACTTSPPQLSHQQNLVATTIAGRGTQAQAGPMRLAIQTDLMQPGAAGAKRIDLMTLAEEKGFRTQALPNGPLVFQEQFTKTASDLEITRPFAAADTSRRYTLHVQKMSGTPTGSIEVNLNGIDWIKAEAFSNGQEESQQNSLLLNANNSLRVRIQGAEGAAFQVSVVEAGAAGTILRPQGRPGPNDTQATRVQRNDTNIFDPSNPNSLGGLEPYEGDLLTEEYGPPMRIGESQANGTKARIRVGVLTVVLKQPVADNLAALQTRFPVTVLNEYDSFGDRFAVLAVEMDEVNLGHLASDFAQLNQRPDGPQLSEALFSSVNTAKTIAVAAQLENNALDLIYGVSLESISKKASAAIDTQEETEAMGLSEKMTVDQANLTTPPSIPVKASSLWWLDAIHARESWQYSMGQNATVAVLDSGFGINESSPIAEPPDFHERIVSEQHLRNCEIAPGKTDSQKLEYCNVHLDDQALDQPNNYRLRTHPEHGLWVTSLLASGDNDQDGIVGVAPRAKILPMLHVSGVDQGITSQLENIDKNPQYNVDVVNISLGRPMHLYDVYFANSTFFNEIRIKEGMNTNEIIPGMIREPNYTPVIANLYRSIYKLYKKKIIVVAAAGNNNLKWDRNSPYNDDNSIKDLSIPAAMGYVIPVGAYQVESGQTTRARFNIYSNDDLLEEGETFSNYGSHIGLWAPGKALWVQSYSVAPNNYKPTWHVLEGTSHAAPLVAGAAALIKSMDKSLGYEEVYNLLYNSASPLNDSSFQQGIAGPVYSKGLNVLEALKNVSGALPATNFCLQYGLRVESGYSVPFFSDLNDSVPGSGAVNATLKGKPLIAALPGLQYGDFVNVLGWSKTERSYMAENELHAIQVSKSATSCQQTGFGMQSLSDAPPAEAPPSLNTWIVRNSQLVPVTTGQQVGVSIDVPNMQDVRIEIDGQLMPIQEVAQNYLVFEVLESLNAGAKNLVIRYGTESITLSQALELASEEGCEAEEWSLRVYNVDDTATAYVNLNNILTVNYQGDSGFRPITHLLNKGLNSFRFTLYNGVGGYTWGFMVKKNDQIIFQSQAGQVGVEGANGNDMSKQGQVVYDESVMLTSNKCLSLGGPGLRGVAYANTTFTPPARIEKVFPQLNFIDGNKSGDQFGVGLTDNFSIRFTGALKLPEDYPSGAYRLVVGHDDGTALYLNNQLILNELGQHNYIEDIREVSLASGVSYPLRIDYQEFGFEAELGLFWIRPDGVQEPIPAEAFSH